MAYKQILVVEDDATIRETVSELLVLEGYEVQSCVNGQEALELLKTEPDFGLILLDLMMPKMGGIELLNAMKIECSESVCRIPIVVLTAAGQAVADLGEHQTVALLRKPPEMEDLLEVVQKHCTEHST